MVDIECLILPSLFIFTFAICNFLNRRSYFSDPNHLHQMEYIGTASYSMVVLGGMGGLNEAVLIWYQSPAYLLALLASYASNLVFGSYIIPALDFRVRQARSLGDILYIFYGRTVELIFSSILVIFCLVIMVVFLHLACVFSATTTGISFEGSLAIISLLLAINFWISGGMEAAVCNDLKLLIIACIFAAAGTISLSQTGGEYPLLSASYSRLPHTASILSFFIEYRDILACVACLSALSSMIHPPTIQCLLEAGSTRNMAYANTINAAFKALAILLLWLIISPAHTNLPNVTSISTFLSTLPPPFHVLSIFAVLTLMISQICIYADSAALLYWRNIVGHKTEGKHRCYRIYIWLYCVATVLAFAGSAMIILGLALQLVLLSFLSIPLLFSLLHWRVSEKVFWYNGMTNVLLFSGLCLSGHLNYTVGLIAFVISAGLTAAMCCFDTKGFIMVSQRLYKSTEVWFYPTPHAGYSLTNLIYNTLHGFAHNLKSSITREPSYNIHTYRNFGILCCAIYLMPYYMRSPISQQHTLFFINVRLLCCLLSIGLIMAQLWPEKAKKDLLPLYWYITLWLSMPFETGLALAASSPTEQAFGLATCFLLTAYALKPKEFWLINLSGILASMAIYKAFFGDISWHKGMNTAYPTLRYLIFPLFCGGIMSCLVHPIRREAHMWILSKYGDLFDRLEYAMAGAYYANMLSREKKAGLNENLAAIAQEFIGHFPAIDTATPHNTDASTHSLSECLNRAIAQYKRKIDKTITINKYIVGDIAFIGKSRELQYALYLLLYQMSLYNPEISVIEIWNENKKLYISVSKEEILAYSICRYLTVSTANDSPAPMKMSILLCNLVMRSVGGTFSHKIDGANLLLTFMFPRLPQ